MTAQDYGGMHPEERALLAGIQGAEISVLGIEDLRDTNLGPTGADFGLGVAQIWLRFSFGPFSERVLRVFSGGERVNIAPDDSGPLPEGENEAVEMVNSWLGEGDSRVNRVTPDDSELIFDLSDGRFLTVCGGVDMIGIMAGHSASAGLAAH